MHCGSIQPASTAMRYPNPRGSGQCLHKGPFPNGTRQDVESLWFPFRSCKTVGPVNEATATNTAAGLTAPRAEPTCPIMGVSDFCPGHTSTESPVSDGKVRMVNGLRAAFEAKPAGRRHGASARRGRSAGVPGCEAHVLEWLRELVLDTVHPSLAASVLRCPSRLVHHSEDSPDTVWRIAGSFAVGSPTSRM